jgi:hypothetical protein
VADDIHARASEDAAKTDLSVARLATGQQHQSVEPCREVWRRQEQKAVEFKYPTYLVQNRVCVD